MKPANLMEKEKAEYSVSPENTSLQNPDKNLEEDIEKHDTLNPKLFGEDDKIKPEVLDKIHEIVDTFLEELAVDEVEIVVDDIVLIGSNVSYNYTKDSDLDIHIIADTSELDCPEEIYSKLYSAYRSLFNKKFDIDFYGIPIELYVETNSVNTISNGVYSVNKNDWIKKPVQQDVPEIDMDAFNQAFEPWEARYEQTKESADIDEINSFIEDIYALRKYGIQNTGEYGQENLIFKEARNRGYLDDLKELRYEVLSNMLSLGEDDFKQNFETEDSVDPAETEFPMDESLLKFIKG